MYDFCKSCIYNQDSKAVMNCNKIKCCYLKENEEKCLLYEKEEGIFYD